jgi:hypothetical protein
LWREPEQCSDELNNGQVVYGAFLEASGDCAKALDVVKEDFNAVTLAVLFAVKTWPFLSTGMGADDGLHLLRSNLSDDFVAIIGRVRNKSLALSVNGHYFFGDRAVMLLARCEFDVERAALGIDEGMDFGGEATSRTTQCILFDPPFPPEASWCARTTVASMMQPSSSTSNCNAFSTLAHIPPCDHRLNRL